MEILVKINLDTDRDLKHLNEAHLKNIKEDIQQELNMAMYSYEVLDVIQNKISKEKLGKIRSIIVNKIIENDFIMFDEKIRNYLANDNELDLIEVIVDLYEYLHQIIEGEEYNYMFHWANKIGAWVDTGNFDKEVNNYE